MTFAPYPLQFGAGVQRDNTELSGNFYTDALWCRFQYGKPRKMGGYKVVTPNMTAISRALLSQTLSGYSYIHSGYASGIESYQVDPNGITSIPAVRTPAGFTSSPNNIWQLDSYYDTTSGTQQILAFVVPGLLDIGYGASTGNLYAGSIYGTTALTSVPGLATDATGGIMVAPPYTVLYGSNGLVQWSVSGKPLDFTNTGSGAARVTAQKIVRGLPLRGGGGFSPSALLWSIDSLIRMYFQGGATVFAFDTLSDDSSILSHNGVVEYAGVYYWIGQDRFLQYNGVVREIPNDKNLNWFFDNLNRTYAQKAFAVKNTRYGEIWFCAPLFGATEPNYAAIYNVRENTWYDTLLPNSGRSFGIKNDVAAGMIMSGIDLYNGTTYRLWQHETGLDEADVNNTNAVNSYFDTPIMTAESFQQPMDKNLHIDTLIPDLVQSNSMTITPYLRGNARSDFTQSASVSFADVAATTQEQQVPLKVSARQIKLRFQSNVQGGSYQLGKSIAYIETDGARRTQ